MKDYKLSEIKAICKKTDRCCECELRLECAMFGCNYPHTWQIDEEEQDDTEYYTLEQMQAMSPKCIEEHWNKVQRSLQRIKEKQDDD